MALNPGTRARILVATTNKGKLREFAAALPKDLDLVSLGDLTAAQRRRYGDPVEDGESFAHNGLVKLAAALGVFAEVDQEDSEAPDWLLVDDSGLVVPDLDFEPGVHSAHYAGLPRDDARNRNRLAAEVAASPKGHLTPSGEHRLEAYFVAALLLLDCRGSSVPERVEKLRALCALLQESAKPTAAFASRTWERNVFEAMARQGKPSFGARCSLRGESDPGAGLQIFYGFCHGQVSDREQHLLEGEGHGYDALFFPQGCPNLSFASIPLAEKNLMSHRGRALAAAFGSF